MASRNDITGDKIQTKVVTQEYRENYDKIFKKDQKKPEPCQNYGRCNCSDAYKCTDGEQQR